MAVLAQQSARLVPEREAAEGKEAPVDDTMMIISLEQPPVREIVWRIVVMLRLTTIDSSSLAISAV